MSTLQIMMVMLAFSFISTSQGMSYPEALQRAQNGEATLEVLKVFREAYEDSKKSFNEALKIERKTNLAALLLDVANRQADPAVFMKMYREAEALSLEVIAVAPADDAANSNLKAARNSMQLRFPQGYDMDDDVQASSSEEDDGIEGYDDDDDDDDDDDKEDQVESDTKKKANLQQFNTNYVKQDNEEVDYRDQEGEEDVEHIFACTFQYLNSSAFFRKTRART